MTGNAPGTRVRRPTRGCGCGQPVCSHLWSVRLGLAICDRARVTRNAPLTAGLSHQVRGRHARSGAPAQAVPADLDDRG